MSIKLKISALTAAIIATAVVAAPAAATVVNANGTTPGDNFTNANSVNMGQAVGASGWVYNNVRNSGTVGINTTYAMSGNGSAYFQGTIGPGGASSKADIEYYAAAGQSLGKLSDLSGMSYDWYRNSASTNSAIQHPSLRILVDVDGNLANGIQFGSINYERAYNVGGNVPVDTWVHETVGNGTFMWSSGSGLGTVDINGNGYAYDSTLQDFKAYLPNAVIIGFSSGIGSGWGPFEGAVDNISWTLNGVTTTSNFEVAGSASVPEPGSLALIGLGLVGLMAAGRRKKA